MTLIQLLEKKWLVPLLAAVLAFLGALGGSLISGLFQLNQWENQVAYEKKKAV